ncbi:hypothetical protein LUW75_16200 [Streptomyces sp. MRC013]|uniref:hypothetical protein n=1 Tax=Streptomyces sp. MRC013 TaxID=2898276 RepID=UPI0020275165|nr:hypothetical protein [Streptomyces sp. MRC013]URM91266.1 hypothetical protein LUW75_16200 [Streptomyces sp. MRC013]
MRVRTSPAVAAALAALAIPSLPAPAPRPAAQGVYAGRTTYAAHAGSTAHAAYAAGTEHTGGTGHLGGARHAGGTASTGPRAGATVDGREPSCGDPEAAAFPIRTRIAGGPAVYEAGAAPRTWYVELTNTTRRPCRNIHPVIVLTDASGRLAPASVRMAFSTAPGGPPRAVRAEHTDHREVVGVLDDDTDRAFGGFTVPPSGTVRVPVHLAFASGTRPDEVTAAAAVVQRRGGDGDWVGTSPPYRFALTAPAAGTGPGTPPPPAASPGNWPVRATARRRASSPSRRCRPAASSSAPSPSVWRGGAPARTRPVADGGSGRTGPTGPPPRPERSAAPRRTGLTPPAGGRGGASAPRCGCGARATRGRRSSAEWPSPPPVRRR